MDQEKKKKHRLSSPVHSLYSNLSLSLSFKDDDEVDLRERKMKVRRRNEWMIYQKRERETGRNQ